MKFLSYLVLSGLLYSEPVNQSCSCRIAADIPSPAFNDNTLFYIQRTPNHNAIVYDLNVENNLVVEKDPVHPYWIRFQEQGQKEELSYLQEHYAYGLRSEKITDDQYEMRFVSYRKMSFYLKRSAVSKKFHIYATVNKKSIEVKRVFLQIEGGSFWFPKVTCAQVTGTEQSTGLEVVEYFKP
ncbi:MAG: DUF4833 domain-containing protein [Bacteroidota bacterium]